MALLISINLSDIAITALVYTRIIPRIDYFRFFVPGIIIMGLFTAASDTGRRVWLVLREGVVQYYLALPLSTMALVFAYILSGGLGGLVYSMSLLLVGVVLIPPQGLLNALVLVPFFFVLSAGLAGIAALAAYFGKRELYWVYAQAIQVALVTFSTIFYPIETIEEFLPQPGPLLAEANPLSLAAKAMRQSVFAGGLLDLNLLARLAFSSVPLVLAGIFGYALILSRIRLYGKP